MRVYELARKYEMTSKEIVGICHGLGITVKAAQSTVKGDDLLRLTDYFNEGKGCTPVAVLQPTTITVNMVPVKDVAYVSTECEPFITIGELAKTTQDAITALKAAQNKVTVFLPYSNQLESDERTLECVQSLEIEINEQTRTAEVFTLEHEDVTYVFVKEADYFTREQMYGYEDDAARFAFFSHAVLQLLPLITSNVSTVYVNDWHTSFIPLLMRTTYNTSFYQSLETVLTVHSLEYQGWFEPSVLTTAVGISTDYYTNGLTRMGSQVNILKSGIETAHRVKATDLVTKQSQQADMIACGITGVLKQKVEA